jgi:hypothetical protein
MPTVKFSRTTVGGIIGGLALLFGQLANLTDSDPKTVLEFTQVLAALAMLGIGWSAADSK